MADQVYQIVFQGKIAPDSSVEEVKANLAKLFHADEPRIDRLFSGQTMVLKKGLDREAGERYRVLLEKAGALCEVVAIPSSPRAPIPPKVPDRTKATPPSGPKASEGAEGGKTSNLMQRAAAMTSKVKAVRPGDLQQTLGAIREKVQDMDAEEAGKKVSTLVEGVATSVKSEIKQGRLAELKRKKVIWVLAATLGLGIALVIVLSGGSRAMPIEKAVFNQFTQQYYREIQKADLANIGTNVLIERAREVLDDMGYDFDRTILFWLFHKDQVESEGGLDVYSTILVEPVAVAVAAGLSSIDAYIAPETRQIFETAATIPSGVDLASIRMIKACPAEGTLLKHDDLLQVLKDNGVALDSSQPDLAIADAFFGLERAGFIKIQRRWEKDVQFSDIEILDLEEMNAVEAKLRYLGEMKSRFSED